MKVLKGILLVTLSSIFSDAPQASELEEKSAWGKPVKGVQIRLSTDSAVLKFGQIPSFKCDVRNNGKHKWKLPLSQRQYLLEVDGHRFTYPGKSKEWKLLKPGDKLSDVAIQGDPGWVRGGMFPDYYLALRPDKHTIRLGVVPQAAKGFFPPKPALCMSNPVIVEVVSLDGMADDTDLPGMTIYGKRNQLKLSSWDRNRGKCGINFKSGSVTAMPAKIRKASQADRVKWIRDNGIDAIANISGQEHGLIGIDFAVRSFEKYPWGKISAKKAQDLMRDIKVTTGKTSMLGPVRGSYRLHYVVKTRDGIVFQLNIEAGLNRNNIVEFSYSRVQPTVDVISVSRTTQIAGLKERPSIDKCSGISIYTPNNWVLYINKDGSAVLMFGNSDRSPQFPVGSFKFEQVYSSIASGEYGAKFDRPYRIVFHIPDTPHDNPLIKWSHCMSSFDISVDGNRHIAELFKKTDALSKQYWKQQRPGMRKPNDLRKRNPIIQPISDE